MSSAKRKPLGKGLKALIPINEEKSSSKQSSGLFQCPIDKLAPNENQPRQSFDKSKLEDLTESVRSKGVIQPIVVRAMDDGRFQIVAGERRWRASQLAGLKKVPVVVKDLSGAEILEVALIENIQREDLNPLEQAEAYRQLIEEHGLTQEGLAKRVGKQRSSVANALRLLKLPDEVRRFLLTGELTMGHARAILGVEGKSKQKALARKVVREGLSVRACEEMVRNVNPKTGGSKKASLKQKVLTSTQRRLVEELQRLFGTKVDLQKGRKGGKLIIHYFSDGELDRILQVIQGN